MSSHELNSARAAFGTIVADPPWQYTASGKVDGNGDRRGAPAESRYPTMTNAALAALPVERLAAADAHLYLWVTNPRLYGGRVNDGVNPRDIAAAWGFKYQTLLTWVKTGAPGLGFYFRGATEHVLFCTRGRASIPTWLRESNVIDAPRGRHSAKPSAFFDKVERVSPAPRLELFARTPRLGWERWGDEIDSTVEVAA